MSYDKQKLEEVFSNPKFCRLAQNDEWDEIVELGYFHNHENKLNLGSFIIQELYYPLFEKIDYIPDLCFYGDPNLRKFDIPYGVTKIGYCAFDSCYSLTKITIPKSVTEIEGYAFDGCKNLLDITIPDSVTEIGNGAFRSCENLTDIMIPDGVTKIGEYTFVSCKNLTNIIIPNSVIEIELNAFTDCNNLKNVYYRGTEEEWNGIGIADEDNEFLLNANIHFNS